MAKKTENGQEFSSSAYLIVPDPSKPSTWKLRIEESPGKVTVAQLGRAAAALGKGFRGNKVQASSGDRASALRKLRARYKSLGVSGKDLPAVLQQSLTDLAIETLHKLARVLLEKDVAITDKEAISESLEDLTEGMYMGGFTAVQGGTLSYEAVCCAVACALKEYQQDPSTDMEEYPCCNVLATFSDTVIFEQDGKTYQVGYKMNGTDAMIDGDPVEVQAEFSPVPVTAQESRGAALIEYSPSGTVKTAKINRELRVLEGTTLISGRSENGKKGRVYPESTLRKIASMAEGLPAYLNHTTPDLAFKPRPVQDLIGRHRNVRYDAASGTVKSDLHIAEHQAPLVFSLAEKFGDHIGNSLVSRGLVQMEGETEVVKDVLALRSADLVSDPASTKGLFESKDGEPEQTFETLIEELRKSITTTPTGGETVDIASILTHLKANPADQKLMAEHFGFVLKDEHVKEVSTLKESVEVIGKERETLKGQLLEAGKTIELKDKELKESKEKNDKHEAEKAVATKRVKLEEAITGHDLGKKFGKVEGVISETFKGTLMEAAEADWGKLLDDRLQGVSKVAGTVKLPLSEGKDPSREDSTVIPEGMHAKLASAF